jgi:hypothetical protein
MNAMLKSGKEVRGVNSGRGLEGAAFDFNTGEPYDEANLAKPLYERDIRHLHVYLGDLPFQFICSQEPLTVGEIGEANKALQAERELRVAEEAALRETLISEAGDQLIAERQRGNSDKQSASRDIVRVLFPEAIAHRQHVSWGEVKAGLQELRSRAAGKVTQS